MLDVLPTSEVELCFLHAGDPPAVGIHEIWYFIISYRRVRDALRVVTILVVLMIRILRQFIESTEPCFTGVSRLNHLAEIYFARSANFTH